jgi:hypothetical protein
MELTKSKTNYRIWWLALLIVLEIFILWKDISLALLPKNMESVNEAGYLLFTFLPLSILFGLIGFLFSFLGILRKNNFISINVILLMLSLILLGFFPVFLLK